MLVFSYVTETTDELIKYVLVSLYCGGIDIPCDPVQAVIVTMLLTNAVMRCD